ncbi:hypothetical protein DFH29DRAFT_962486 [Suillus ampliporus]|nr:hypothetical protein DFH29DRAFT_962486 [Suillus ampliporus]
MISRTRRALISLVFAPWVSAAPAMQRSEPLLVESLPATCNLDLSTIQYDLCTIVGEILDDGATLTSPHIIDLGEYSQKDGRFQASAARPQTMSDTPISRSHDLTSDAGRLVTEHNTQSPTSAGVHVPEGNIGDVVISFTFLPERHTDEFNPVHVIGCTYRLTWESLHTCDPELVEFWTTAASDDSRPKRYEVLQEEEGLLGGQTKWKRDTVESDASETGNDRPRDEGTGHNVDTRSDEGNENEGNDEKPDDERPDDNPTDEQDDEQDSEFIPPTDRNSWSLTTVLFVTSFVLIIATRLFYARLQGLVRSYLKPNHFRVGESVLLRWAREENFDDEEEDTMVNGSLTTGEEIPLKPSPRKNFVIQYGSAQ